MALHMGPPMDQNYIFSFTHIFVECRSENPVSDANTVQNMLKYKLSYTKYSFIMFHITSITSELDDTAEQFYNFKKGMVEELCKLLSASTVNKTKKQYCFS